MYTTVTPHDDLDDYGGDCDNDDRNLVYRAIKGVSVLTMLSMGCTFLQHYVLAQCTQGDQDDQDDDDNFSEDDDQDDQGDEEDTSEDDNEHDDDDNDDNEDEDDDENYSGDDKEYDDDDNDDSDHVVLFQQGCLLKTAHRQTSPMLTKHVHSTILSPCYMKYL